MAGLDARKDPVAGSVQPGSPSAPLNASILVVVLHPLPGEARESALAGSSFSINPGSIPRLLELIEGGAIRTSDPVGSGLAPVISSVQFVFWGRSAKWVSCQRFRV